MPPAEQGESAADRTFDAVKDVADTPRSAAAHSKEAATVSARGAVKRVGTKKRALNGRLSRENPRPAIVAEWLLRATKCR